MNYYEVAPTRIVRADQATFTYESETPLKVGTLVTIPIGKQHSIGVVVKTVSKPAYATKPMGDVIEDLPLPESLIGLSLWLAEYYRTPLATVLQTVLPRGLTTKRRAQERLEKTSFRDRTQIVLNPEQTQAVTSIMAQPTGTVLLQGVTGSGKTEVYKELARQTIASGRSVIVLVPEISLTSQIIDEFTHDFPSLIVTHSHMTEATRHLAWKQALEATQPVLVIGPRSALFMPVPHLGAIIVDEAHEPSYKQEQAPRYSALRAASVLGKLCEARVVFGSATPLITDRYIAESNNSLIVRLDKSARSNAKASAVELVDMTKRQNFTKHRFFSNKLLEAIEQNIATGKQTLIFHNRRGSASTTLCENCGWSAQCPRCFVPLVLHADTYTMSCHICDIKQKVPTSCPVCNSADIIHKGIGTKLIESELNRLFPKTIVARFDGDNANADTVNERYKELYSGEINIAIGTQVVAKGLDLPKLHTVGVIQADSGLALPDYTAAERAFQLLAQVVGRVGRDERDTQTIVQSYQPTHPVVQFGLKQDYEGFYQYALAERKKAGFPPFRFLLQLTDVYKTEASAVKAAKQLSVTLKSTVPSTIEVLGPTPAFYERQHDTYRWQLVLKSTRREALADVIKYVPPTHWQYDLDPSSLL
ncbi:MAG: primosome assembly protein PriA [Candidatus Saccharibacteria bacterium]|nr:primosome assembly protein PriA [Candidatus Saccharibacteria bacterium]